MFQEHFKVFRGFEGRSRGLPEEPRRFQGLPRQFLEVSEGFQLVSGVSRAFQRVSSAF